MATFQIVAILFNISLFVFVIELIRRNRLKEKYSILWLASVAIMLILSIWRDLLHKSAKLLGIADPPNLLFIVGFIFLLIIVLHFSTVVSKESETTKTLAQKIALLEFKLKQIENPSSTDQRRE